MSVCSGCEGKSGGGGGGGGGRAAARFVTTARFVTLVTKRATMSARFVTNEV